MTLREIIDEVQLIVQDNSFFESDDAIISRVNEAVLWACSQPGVEIPSLKQMGQFTTTTEPYAEIAGVTTSFTGRVLRAGKPGTKLYHGIEDLYDDFYPLDKVGPVEAVCVQRNMVWYQGIPAEPEVVLCILQGDPPRLEDDDDVPVVIPEFLQRQLVVHGVVAELYSMIEDGVDGQKVNTVDSRFQRDSGLQRFKEWLGSRRQHVKTSHWKH